MQVNTTVWHQLMPFRMAVIKKRKQMLVRMCTIGNVNWFSHCWNSMELPQEIINWTTPRSSNPTSGNRSKGCGIILLKRYLHLYFHCSTIYNSQDRRKKNKCPSTDEWIKKICCKCVSVVVIQPLSHVQLFVTAWTSACRVPRSLGFPRQEYWSELPFPPPGDLSDPGIEPVSLALVGGFFTTSDTWKVTLARADS